MQRNNPDQYFKRTIGGTEVAIMGVSLPSDFGDDSKTFADSEGDFFTNTSFSGSKKVLEKFDDAMVGMGTVLSEIAGKGWEVLNTDIKAPDELTLTLGMGYSFGANIWVLGGEADLTFEVEMKWKKKGLKE